MIHLGLCDRTDTYYRSQLLYNMKEQKFTGSTAVTGLWLPQLLSLAAPSCSSQESVFLPLHPQTKMILGFHPTSLYTPIGVFVMHLSQRGELLMAPIPYLHGQNIITLMGFSVLFLSPFDLVLWAAVFRAVSCNYCSLNGISPCGCKNSYPTPDKLRHLNAKRGEPPRPQNVNIHKL